MSDAFQNDPLAEQRTAFNPLQTMVQRFKEMTGPRPAPDPAPTLEEQGHGRQRSYHDSPAWNAPRRQNLALPPGAPAPRQAAFQAFVPASIPRPQHQWGAEEQFAPSPQPFEVPNLVQGLSRFFGQNGSGPISQIAAALNPTVASFMQGVQKGQLESAQQAREQMALHLAQLKETQEEEMYRYAEVLAEHGALNETTDIAKMVKPVNGKSLMEDLYDTAVEIGDNGKPGTVGSLIAAGAMPSEVYKFLELRDARLRDLQKTKAAVDQDTVDNTGWGMQPAEARPAPSDTSHYFGLPAPAAATTAPTTSQPAPAAPSPTVGAQPAAQPAETDALPADEEAVVTEGLRGVQPDAEFAKRFPKKYHDAMLEIDRQKGLLDSIIRNPPKDPMTAIRAVNPNVASDVSDVLNYQMPASGGISGTGGSPGTKGGQYSDMLRNLATTIDHNWNQGFYQDQQRFRTNAQTANAIARGVTTATAGAQVLQAVANLPAGASDPDVFARAMANAQGGWGADPRYVALNAAWLRYNMEINTLIRSGGGGVTETAEAIRTVPQLLGTPADYAVVVKQDAELAKGRLDQFQNQWRQIGGKGMFPGFDPNAYKDLTRIANMPVGKNTQ